MIYSIGHGKTTPDNVARIMRDLDIKTLVDVRSKPFSKWQPAFNRDALRRLLGEAYLWRPDLGGLKGNVISEESLDWLACFGESQNIIIMCSESNPQECHRHTKIAARLWQRTPPVPVIHLDGQGNETPAFTESKEGGEPGLF